MNVSDPGVGLSLRYEEVNSQVNLSCQVEEVFPEPELEIDWDYGLETEEDTKHSEKFR